MTSASFTASTAYPCQDTPRIVLFTLSLSMFCSPAGAVLCGTSLGLEYERPRAAQDPPQRARPGVPASLPPEHLVYHVQMPYVDSNPYFEGFLHVHSIIFLSVCGPRIFFLPVDFRSNFPPKPRRGLYSTASSVRVRWTIFPCPPCACSRRLGYPWPCRGDDCSIMQQRTIRLAPGRNPPSLGSLSPLRTRRARKYHAGAEYEPESKSFD